MYRAMVCDGMMFGAMIDKERKLQYVQEGRLGYEEYAARVGPSLRTNW